MKRVNITPNARIVLEKRYLTKDSSGKVIETPEEMFMRVAEAVSQAELKFGTKAAAKKNQVEFQQAAYGLMADMLFLPNSPTLMNAGRPLGQLSACFVLPVGDSMEEIFDAIKYTALIHKSGGGTGFSFSRLRPSNDIVGSTNGVASGPISFMKIFDAATEQVKQGGTRRGANMGILRVDHPDVMNFIVCKDSQKELNNFNISVGITDAFMAALEAKGEYDIINPKTKAVVGQLNAKEVFDKVVVQAWKNGEPGVVFLDKMNAGNPTPHIGEIESTNPCGEQPLLPYESCNLGSINLALLVKDGEFDFRTLRKVVRTAVRFLDNVIEVNNYPIPQIDQMTRANRKIGLGVMGWADALIKLGIPYTSREATELGAEIMQVINVTGHQVSIELATERGAFPNFKGSSFDQAGQAARRNATITTIAPTGTISIIANSSSGVEPLFAVAYVRNVLDNDILVEVSPLFEEVAKARGFYSEELVKRIAREGHIHFPEIPEDVQRVFVTAHDVTPEAHIRMQAAFQQHTDNAVSKTVNFPSTATIEDVEKVYRLAYSSGCKGVTIYRDGSRDEQVLSTGATAAPAEAPAPVVTQAIVSSKKKSRPRSLPGSTYQMQTGCGPLYVTINEDGEGPFEVFTTMGKAGGCAASQCEAVGRMTSLAWRSGIKPQEVIKQLRGISCHLPSGFGENKVLSCSDAIAQAVELWLEEKGEEIKTGKYVQSAGACPECGGPVEHEGGCAVCRVCGRSECA